MELVLFAAIALAFFVGRALLADQRRRECQAWASANEFSFLGDDDHGLAGLPMALLDRGHSHKWRNAMRGAMGDHTLYVADFHFTEGHDKNAQHYVKSVAVVEIPARVPWVEIQQESVLSTLAGAVGFDDLQFESGEFNDRVRVRTNDRQFAYKLIDARMMEWLLLTSLPVFEVNGTHVLVAFDRLPLADFPALVSHIRGFVKNIPRIVLADYAVAR